MAYLVEFTRRAERDFIGLFEEIRAAESDSALRWFRGLTAAVLSLEEMPNRCPVTRESAQLRHLLYGRKRHVYRVIYRVFEKQKRVEVLHIRHGARQDFTETDLG
jgi:plasmid stabilization system protein ParE